MNYCESMEYIHALQSGEAIKPGLYTISELLKRLNNPQQMLRFVHIAGTNGKGSVASFISSALAAHGIKVGRYVSPAVFNEMEKIRYMQGEYVVYISEAEYAMTVTKIRPAIDDMLKEGLTAPTVFEIETVVSFLMFVEWNCDIVVLETGMGGRQDSTNVVQNVDCSVITSVSMDHMRYLGDSLEDIASEKAGIIKNNISVVTCQQQEKAIKCIEEECRKKRAELIESDLSKATIQEQSINGSVFTYKEYESVKIGLCGTYQIGNAVLALECLNVLKKRYNLNNQDIINGFGHTVWPGRFHLISKKPCVVADGAHNPDGIKKMCESIDTYFPNRKRIGITGVFSDKDYKKMAELAAPFFEKIYTVTAPSKRGLSADELCEMYYNFMKKHTTVTSCESMKSAVEKAITDADTNSSAIIIFGSLSIMKEAYDLLLDEDKDFTQFLH